MNQASCGVSSLLLPSRGEIYFTYLLSLGQTCDFYWPKSGRDDSVKILEPRSRQALLLPLSLPENPYTMPACEEASSGHWRRTGHLEDQWRAPGNCQHHYQTCEGGYVGPSSPRWADRWLQPHDWSPVTAAETLPTRASELCVYAYFAKQINR